MRVQTTRRTESIKLRHSAGFHSSHRGLVAQLASLATTALRRDEPVAIALRPITEEALRHAIIGPAELISLDQPEGSELGSGQSMAARRARELRELTGGGARPVTVLTEHISRFDGPDGHYWTELDAALNVALADLPVSLTCFFPELPLHAAILDGALHNHPRLLVDGDLRINPGHRCPREVLGTQPASPPTVLGPPEVELSFGAWQLHDVRAAVEQAVRDSDYQTERVEDVVLAVNEVATNAVEHGGADAQLYIWTDDGLVCEIHDRGILGDPLPGLQAPHPSNPRGRGVWIARQLCDTLHVWADSTGTHVRMRAGR